MSGRRIAALIAAGASIGCGANGAENVAAVHLNQTGFLPEAEKRATIVTDAKDPFEWRILDDAGAVILSGRTTPFGLSRAAGHRVHTADFSDLSNEGDSYVLVVDAARSATFAVAADVYHPLKYDALAFFYHQRSGTPIEAALVGDDWARPIAHAPDEAGCVEKDHRGNVWGGCPYTLDVTGGWYDAGDHGKYVVNAGVSVWTLFNYAERIASRAGAASDFADGKLRIPERANGVSDLLDEIRWEMDFLLRMQVPEGTTLRLPRGNQAGKPTLSLTEVDASGMAHHKVQDEKWTPLPMPPHLDPERRFLTYPSTAATLNLAAVAAQCARLFREIDAAYAARCLATAERAYAAAVRVPDALAHEVLAGGGGAYGDSQLADEFYWAAAELFVTTGDERYREAFEQSPLHVPSAPGALGSGDIFWSEMRTLGAITLANAETALPASDVGALRDALVDRADQYLAEAARDGYGAPFDRKYNWGSNADMANRGIVLATAYDFTGEPRYRDGVVAIMDYLLGRNPLGQSYVSGYGEKPMEAPHHRFWARVVDPSLPGPPPGALAGGPNETNLADPVAKKIAGKCVAQTCYVDDIEAYALNEVAINWNAPLFWLAAFLDEGD